MGYRQLETKSDTASRCHIPCPSTTTFARPREFACWRCTKFLHIQSVSNILDTMWIGVQDICADSLDKGAFTGDISAQQAVDMGVKFVIIGHSERRQYHSESHDKIRQKSRTPKPQILHPFYVLAKATMIILPTRHLMFCKISCLS